ncbi:MAG: hypothetical protein K9G60_06535 [Pseudolabrys sp.]|nr:hypothetical protein [Pseudolabrys sp.]
MIDRASQHGAASEATPAASTAADEIERGRAASCAKTATAKSATPAKVKVRP